MRIALVLLAVSRIAAAKPPELAFIQLAPTRDGGGWALVRARDDIAIRRVSPDGTLAAVAVPTDRAIRAIAASSSDDSLWVLTDGPLLERASDGTWRRVMLAPEPAWRGWQPTTAVIPIEPHRAVVIRACGDSCSEVSMVDSASSAESRRFDVLLGPAVADGRGGLWTIVQGRVLEEPRSIGYAHVHDGRWDAWTMDSRAFDGMANRHAEIAPTRLAADGRGGAIVANDDELATIGPDGTITNRGSIAREHAETRGVIAAGDEALVVSEDPSLVVRHIALSPIRERRVERVPTWRGHGYGNSFDVEAAGTTIWLVSTDAVFYRSAGAWKTITGQRSEEVRHKVLASVPIDAGLATRPSGPSGGSLGLRPEIIIPFVDSKYPIYGFGPYFEAVIADGAHVEGLFGGGITGILYGDMWAVALSAGADARYSNGSTHPQVAASAFIGLREYNMHLFDAPLGLRVDARPGTSAVPGSVTFSLAIDPVWFVGLGAYVLGKRD